MLLPSCIQLTQRFLSFRAASCLVLRHIEYSILRRFIFRIPQTADLSWLSISLYQGGIRAISNVFSKTVFCAVVASSWRAAPGVAGSTLAIDRGFHFWPHEASSVQAKNAAAPDSATSAQNAAVNRIVGRCHRDKVVPATEAEPEGDRERRTATGGASSDLQNAKRRARRQRPKKAWITRE